MIVGCIGSSKDTPRVRSSKSKSCESYYSYWILFKFAYPPSHICNVDESGCNASKSELAKVLAKKEVKNVHAQIPSEKEWLSVLTSINVAGGSTPHFFIFKGKKRLKDYIHLCRASSTMVMQEKRCVTSYLFSRWMDHFIEQLEELGDLSPTNKHLILLDGYKSHVTLGVIQKAKKHGIDLVSLPSQTSHALQPLDVACFKPFKGTFKVYRNKWMIENNGKKVEKDTLAHWVDLALNRALSKHNILAGFRATGIWPLNLERMQQKMEPSKPYYSIPSEKLIVEEIMEEDLPRGEEDRRCFFVEDEGDLNCKIDTGPEHVPSINQFLKLPKKAVQAPKVLHEPLIDYSQSQLLTSNEHIKSIEEIAHKKHIESQ